MDRRQFMMAGAALAAGVASGAGAQESMGPAKPGSYPAALADPKKRELAEAGAECVKAGDVCMEHCLELLRQGDKSMVKCSETVAAMLPMCRALAALATQGSPYLAEHARTCAKVCRDCEAACKVHASHHESCKRCMETCQRCAADCEKFAA
jgi:Cys-rich four helix bundle protein (predicted Tat secretion target)